jgi:predicted 3-demethylubiquinone-9 3-methyltransferase (glyoxalase superfamily)
LTAETDRRREALKANGRELGRAQAAMMQMNKINIAALEAAIEAS